MDFNEEELEEQTEINEEEINENEPVQEPDSSDYVNIESPLKVKKANTKKNNIKKFIAKKMGIIIAIVLGIAIFVQILIQCFDFDLVGIGNPKPKYYQTPACGKVFLTWEKDSYYNAHKNDADYEQIKDPKLVDLSDDERFDYKEYDFNTYISGVVWTDNDKALDVDNEVVYQAMAIAARSRLIANLPDNCVVLKYYNDQAASFTELDGTEEKYTEITSAVSLSKGIIIGRKGVIIPAMYDAFSYVSKRKEDDESYNNAFFYHMMNENKEKQQYIPADWVGDLIDEKGLMFRTSVIKHVNETKKLESMSLYGAKYLLEKVDSQYELYRILEEYYGRDIEYYTIDSSFSFGNGLIGTSSCMWWPIGGDGIVLNEGIPYATGSPSSTTITSQFGPRNLPLPGASSYHRAIDISGNGADGLLSVIAVADGTVIATNSGCVAGDNSCGGSLGNYIKIEHSDGTITRYGHLYSLSVNNGDTVKQGQVIGILGNTGNSTGPHLDFQIMVNGVAVNPLNYVSASNPRMQCLGSIMGGYIGGSNQEFINFIASYAVEDMHSSGILASVTIAQAILESNWGNSGLSKNYNNYFGMKAGSSWTGSVVELPTTECNGDNCYSTTAIWRVYNNPLQSIQDHSNLLHASRYSGVVGETDYYSAITIIKNGGYATDPDYIAKIVNIIESNNLTQYDRM